MTRGRPPKCPFCQSTRSVRKGYRRTKTKGLRRIHRCRDCGRKFTPRYQRARPEGDGRRVPEE
ncbi:MAG: hypothetical protein ACOC93_00060 [Planctomycetota bacterium]